MTSMFLEFCFSNSCGPTQTYPDKVAFTKTDISDPDSVDAAVANTVATFGGLDISINCAGIVGRSAACSAGAFG